MTPKAVAKPDEDASPYTFEENAPSQQKEEGKEEGAAEVDESLAVREQTDSQNQVFKQLDGVNKMMQAFRAANMMGGLLDQYGLGGLGGLGSVYKHANNVQKYATGLSFKGMDGDKNGVVDRKEFVKQMKKLFLPLVDIAEDHFEAKANELYDKIDEDKDGKLSGNEMSKAGPVVLEFMMVNFHLVV